MESSTRHPSVFVVTASLLFLPPFPRASPPHNLPIPWVSLPFGKLFECLDIDNIILVWHCLVLERQVLLTSTQLSILTTAPEMFLSLFFPFRGPHACIPLLPHFLIPILSAPMLFLCGINKANLANTLYDLSRECVFVDLDKNLVTLGPDTVPLPPIPPVQKAALRSQLKDNVGMVFREARSLTRKDDYSDSGMHLPSHTKLMAEAMWESKLSLYDEAFNSPSGCRLLNGRSAACNSSEVALPTSTGYFSRASRSMSSKASSSVLADPCSIDFIPLDTPFTVASGAITQSDSLLSLLTLSSSSSRSRSSS
jgi:hypothetical protein